MIKNCFKSCARGIAQGVETIVELARIGVGSQWVTPLEDLKSRRERIVVIANGPSLQGYFDQHPKGIENADHMCVNAFPLSAAYECLRPRFSVFVDPDFWADRCSSRMDDYRNNVFRELIRKTDWEHVVLAPIQAEKKIRSMMNSEKHEVRFRSFNGAVVSRNVPLALRKSLYSLGLAIPSYQTVMNAALSLAVRMGYRNVYVVGADSSFLEGMSVDPASNLLKIVSSHFGKDMSHATPVYKNAEETDPMLLHEYLGAVARMFEGYHEVRRFADAKGVNIVNVSGFSWIDAFTRGIL